MTQLEETAAALIARLHEQIRIANMELARLTHIGAQEAAERERLKCERDRARAERDEQIRGRAGFQQHCADSANKYAQERDEQRARAEKAEARLAGERRSHANEVRAAKQLLGEMRMQSEGGRDLLQCISDHLGGLNRCRKERDSLRSDLATALLRVEAAEAYVPASLPTLKSRAEAAEHKAAAALQSLARVQADYQVLLLGTAHGTKCWMDECGWHCGEDCKAKHAKKCVAAMERDQALADLANVCDMRDAAGRSAVIHCEARNRKEAELTKERDEARAESLKAGLVGREMAETLDAVTAECLKAQRLAKEAGAHCERVLKERDDAREQLAKLEWAGPIVAKWRTCPLCEGANPGDGFGKLIDSELGHRPTCWFAKQKAAPKVNTWHNHRQDCPARTAEDVAWVDSRWQVNGCRTAPIEGPRPRPIGCEGCMCARPSDREPITHGTLLHPEHGEIKSPLVGHVSELLKSGRPVFGCDFGLLPNVAAFKVYRYACGADIGKKDATKSEPARPAPRFKVGEKVWVHGKTHTIASSLWHALFSFRSHKMEDGETISDHDLKPAPQFAVGEWVTKGPARDYVTCEVKAQHWNAWSESWFYDVVGDGNKCHYWEADLTAQTPQHKHDCKGCVCVFLGRYSNRRGGEWDLWYRDAPGRELGFDCGYGLQWWSVNARGGAMDQTIAEARRRAVARGLV